MVYVFLVDGFEEIEAIAPIDIMRRAGIDVKTVGVTAMSVTGSHNITVNADIAIDEVNMQDCDMVVLPGGPGHVKLKSNNKVIQTVKYAYENSLYIGAICASPSIIGELGMLENRRGTCFPGYEKSCKGMIRSDRAAVTDGRIITSRGAGAAIDFGYELVKALKNEKTADELAHIMQSK